MEEEILYILDTPVETMPNLWQNVQQMWEDKPLQSGTQRHTNRNKARDDPKETRQSMGYNRRKNPTHGSREMIAGILTW